MDFDFEGTTKEFAIQLVREIKEREERADGQWFVDPKKVAVYASACTFLFDLNERSYGDFLEIDYEPGEECSVSAHFDSLDIQDDLFEWFKELLLQIDRLEFLPNHEEETVVIKMTVFGVWRRAGE